jgi:hypothetical protein
MQALLLLAHTSPLLVCNIIKSKLGDKVLRIDPVKPSVRRILLFTSLDKARIACSAEWSKDAIIISVCSPLDAQQIKGAIPLDFEPTNLSFIQSPRCSFDTIFNLYNDKKVWHKVKFSDKVLLTKIMDIKLSTNIISLIQSCTYSIAPKSKYKLLHRLFIQWLKVPAKKRVPIEEYLKGQVFKFKDLPKPLRKKFNKWLKKDQENPIQFDKFFVDANTKSNKDVATLAKKYSMNSFDAIVLSGWCKL